MIECSSWANQSSAIGDGKPIDDFIRQEAERIVNAYGNHPSFCMMAYGNEPTGKHSNDYLAQFVSYWKENDSRRLYTSAAGWPNLPVNDFLSDSNPRIQQWGAGVTSIINAQPPSTTYDWSGYTNKFHQPFVSHEIGQWCAYPNFHEMQKYTGVYKARNFEIFQERLKENGLIQLADSFDAAVQRGEEVPEAQREQLATIKQNNLKAFAADKELGGSRAKATIAQAKVAYEKYCPEDCRQILNQLGLDAHPGMIKMFYRLSQMLSDDMTPRSSGSVQNGYDLAKFFNNSKMN